MKQESQPKHFVDEQLSTIIENIGALMRNNMSVYRQEMVHFALDKMLERGYIIEKDGQLWLPFLDAKKNEYGDFSTPSKDD